MYYVVDNNKIMKRGIENIDLGDPVPIKIPYGKRKHVTFLLGSGFSVPCGMPTGKQLNDFVLNINNESITFDFAGKLAISYDGQKYQTGSPYESCLMFCSEAMKEYSKNHEFDYEQFFDFISSEGIYDSLYEKLAKPFLYAFSDYHQLVFNMKTIYTQLIDHELRKGRKTEILEGEIATDKFGKYENFVKYLDKLSIDHVVDIFSLNHDLLIENLPRTNWLQHEGISDGFHSYRSPYYGELECNGHKYDCRLEEYKAYYNTAIRLYKLHGSLDYLMFKRCDSNGCFWNDNMIKIPYGIGVDKTKKQNKKRLGYIMDWIEYNHDFLSGTKSKIHHYNDSFYKKLFQRFRHNLNKAECLIVIGYGGRDAGINKYILEYFDYHNKPSYIVDPFYNSNEELKQFGVMIGAKPIEKSIEDFQEILW